MKKIIPLFAIASLDYNCYPVVKIRYLEVNPALFNCNLLNLIVLLSSKDTRHQALVLPI